MESSLKQNSRYERYFFHSRECFSKFRPCLAVKLNARQHCTKTEFHDTEGPACQVGFQRVTLRLSQTYGLALPQGWRLVSCECCSKRQRRPTRDEPLSRDLGFSGLIDSEMSVRTLIICAGTRKADVQRPSISERFRNRELQFRRRWAARNKYRPQIVEARQCSVLHWTLPRYLWGISFSRKSPFAILEIPQATPFPMHIQRWSRFPVATEHQPCMSVLPMHFSETWFLASSLSSGNEEVCSFGKIRGL